MEGGFPTSWTIVALLGAGLVIGIALYHLISTRWLEPARRLADTRWQLKVAQERQEQKQVEMGPAFPRAYLHVTRLVQRAESLHRRMEGAVWLDYDAHQQCTDDMAELLRHCQELAQVMKPRRPKGRRP